MVVAAWRAAPIARRQLDHVQGRLLTQEVHVTVIVALAYVTNDRSPVSSDRDAFDSSANNQFSSIGGSGRLRCANELRFIERYVMNPAIIQKTHKIGNSFFAAALRPVDVAGLVAFRIAFGLLIIWECWRYVAHDWIRQYYMVPKYYFSYLGFEWVRHHSDWILLHFALLAVIGLMIAMGLFYRLSTAFFFVGFSYLALIDKANYLNHFYLISLLGALMIVVPAHRALSLDARWWPSRAAQKVPAWTVWLLRFQIGIPYFYGGIAKLNADWLSGEPMRTWLRLQTDFPVIGAYFHEEWMVLLLSYAGLVFDLLVVPLLLWRKTRLAAFALAIVFHLTNARLFSIGVFPWLMIAATTLFLPTSWPRLGMRRAQQVAVSATSNWFPARATQRLALALLLAYVTAQVLIPLRHWLYPDDVNWTGEADRFAWRMKLNEKQGTVRFLVADNEANIRWHVDPQQYLTKRQYREMCRCPDMILQFANHLADEFRDEGRRKVQIYADSWLSLNGRPPVRLIDSTVDLASEALGLRPVSWILPRESLGKAQKAASNFGAFVQPDRLVENHRDAGPGGGGN